MTPPLDRFDWERLIRELDLPLADKCIAYALATYANGDGTRAHPGVPRLARATGAHRATVIRALSHLEELGLIRAVERGGSGGAKRGHSTVYELHPPLHPP